MSEDLLAAAVLDDQEQALLEDRARGAIWGQFVGDAFCLGAHWIYDLDELRRAFPGGVRGFETPAEGHYHFGKRSGDQTHYGDAALVMLESVASLGAVDIRDFGARFVALFGSPTYKGYLDHATKATVANAEAFAAAKPGEAFDYQHGANDDQPGTASRLAAPVALLSLRRKGGLRLLDIVAHITRVTQDDDRAVVYAQVDALILAALLEGNGLHAALESAQAGIASLPSSGCTQEVRLSFGAAADAALESVEAATLKLGQSCPLAHSFPSAVHCTVKHSASFNDAMIANADAGGDSAGRAAMIGAWLGALHGLRAIPAAWREHLTAHDRIEALIDKLVAAARLSL